jgi:hypothetical protein
VPSLLGGAFAPLVASDVAGGAVPPGCASTSDAADRSSRTIPRINGFISSSPFRSQIDESRISWATE